MAGYRYTNLTSAVKDKQSPLRLYLDRQYPNLKAIQTEFRAQSGQLKVESGDAWAGTVGGAFDFQVRFLLDPGYPAVLAWQAFGMRPDLVDAIVTVIATAHVAADNTSADTEQLDRACWALALCTEVYRMGGVAPDTALSRLLDANRFTPAGLLSLASPDALRQLGELRVLASEQLVPHLRGPFHLGPEFDGSRLCAADADLIADGVLLDIKTRLGAKNAKTGVRSDSLALADLYQLLAYTLFDHSDAYGIHSLGIYSARYGALVKWNLNEALASMAGQPVDITRERDAVWQLLGA